jgi:hypothetical protein
MPRTFSGEEPRGYARGAIEEYRHPSMIERYRGLATVFAILSLLLGAYVIKSIVTAKPKPPPPPRPEQSVYIEAVPRKGAPPQEAPSPQGSPPLQVTPPQVAPPQNAPARKGAPPPQ